MAQDDQLQKIPEQPQRRQRFEEIENKDGFLVTANVVDTGAQTAANYPMFFTAHKPCEVLAILIKHGTAGSDGGAVTLQVEKLTGTTAKGSGTNLLSTAFNLRGTANTYTKYTGTGLVLSALQLAEGESLALKSSGTLTAVKDVQVTIYLKPRGKGDYR